jgi:peptidoglycan L-alanyl-D-glutamate endopeptidase CwlK
LHSLVTGFFFKKEKEMPKFGKTSRARLDTCDPRLQEIFEEVVKKWDCTIVCGHRTEEEQNKAYAEKKSKLKFPRSKHNGFPSKAVDVAPYYANVGIDWNDLGGFYMFAGYVIRVAEELGYKLRYGGDWNGNKRTADQKFNDLPHFELVE